MSAEERFLLKWFTWQFETLGISFTVDLSGNIIFTCTSLASVLTLQLYQYFATGKVLKIKKCALSDCEKETTNPKFCSLQHQKLFDVWRRRKKLIEVNGKMQLIKKKSGRPKTKK